MRRIGAVMFRAIRLRGPGFKPRPGQKSEMRFLLHSHPSGGEGVSPVRGEAIRCCYIKTWIPILSYAIIDSNASFSSLLMPCCMPLFLMHLMSFICVCVCVHVCVRVYVCVSIHVWSIHVCLTVRGYPSNSVSYIQSKQFCCQHMSVSLHISPWFIFEQLSSYWYASVHIQNHSMIISYILEFLIKTDYTRPYYIWWTKIMPLLLTVPSICSMTSWSLHQSHDYLALAKQFLSACEQRLGADGCCAVDEAIWEAIINKELKWSCWVKALEKHQQKCHESKNTRCKCNLSGSHIP